MNVSQLYALAPNLNIFCSLSHIPYRIHKKLFQLLSYISVSVLRQSDSNCLRITIGNKFETQGLCQALCNYKKGVVKNESSLFYNLGKKTSIHRYARVLFFPCPLLTSQSCPLKYFTEKTAQSLLVLITPKHKSLGMSFSYVNLLLKFSIVYKLLHFSFYRGEN